MISFDSFHGFPENQVPHALLMDWLVHCAAQYEHRISRLCYQFCDEALMLKYNQDYLQHDYFTDILTFPEGRKSNPIKGDVLINIDRLADNAKKYDQPIKRELLRLMAHGLLHLCGFRDESVVEKEEMTKAEDWCIEALSSVS